MLSSLAAAGEDWMSKLPDDRPITALTLPGTHNSGALHEPLRGTAKCQTLKISQQLEAGVRFLDVRCRHVGDAFQVYHGSIDQKLSFDEVWASVAGFLDHHPTETVVMSVQEEHRPSQTTRSFEETFRAYWSHHPDRWLIGEKMPSLGAARGKVVLFRRFSAVEGPLGFAASEWPDNRTFGDHRWRVQDGYRVENIASKWEAVEAMLKEAATGPSSVLVVNFTSGYQPWAWGLPDIRAVARPMHARLAAWLEQNPRGRLGVVMMDFVTPDLARALYERNGAGLSRRKGG
ncbi:1-phosphatidylinositol phosphodiesterase [Haloferula luteola]|uniref:1-phosphatidylinositol phosphodiesterase n=1 Tax=Haloferula luteola TaxID=595692 RepID=A0A840V836_9BACT|nr:phosphatidylinositol-specific phospholipase C [Haloferula luteola]MBB5350898.1 1-phosphatidylinositol phosphodiesterase [Haloferula luteola]